MSELNRISEGVLGAAIEVHRTLGPGLLESSYELCLAHELEERGWSIVRQQALPLVYKKIRLEAGYRIDLMVEGKVVVEVKAVDALAPVHTAQVLTYLKLTGCQLGLLLNFNEAVLKKGIRRVVL